MMREELLRDRSVLLIQKPGVEDHQRTWCFWEQEQGFFENIVYRKWPVLYFFSRGFSRTLPISPYQYKMIRGEDFYRHCWNELSKYPNIHRLEGEVQEISKHDGRLSVAVNGERHQFDNTYAFNSIPAFAAKEKEGIRLLQHFKGWFVKATEPVFQPGRATLMDFRVSQQHGTAFVYVMPFDERHALVEYTLFTAALLKQEEYDEALSAYLRENLHVNDFTITDTEFGIIPMTDARFQFHRDGLFHIGSAGGQTKASSGYTFQFIQKQSAQIVDYLRKGIALTGMPGSPVRFRFYDNTLLNVLHRGKPGGDAIFTALFKNNEPQAVLRFLDNESSWRDERRIITSLPKWPFLRAGLRQILSR